VLHAHAYERNAVRLEESVSGRRAYRQKTVSDRHNLLDMQEMLRKGQSEMRCFRNQPLTRKLMHRDLLAFLSKHCIDLLQSSSLNALCRGQRPERGMPSWRQSRQGAHSRRWCWPEAARWLSSISLNSSKDLLHPPLPRSRCDTYAHSLDNIVKKHNAFHPPPPLPPPSYVSHSARIQS